MPTLNKLEYLDETKQQIKNALNTNFNSQIQDTDTFRSYVSKINDIYTNWAKVTGEGTSLSLTPTKKGRLQSTLKGATSQDGTPTPESPIPIKVVTGDNSIVIQSKNLFEIKTPDYTGQSAWASYGGANYTKLENGYYFPQRYSSIGFQYDNLEVGENYTISFDVFSNGSASVQVGLNVYQNHTEQNYWKNYTATTTVQRITWTFTADVTNRIAFNTGSTADRNFTITNIQLEKGSATDYVPYQQQTYPISLGSMELAEITENYQDYIYGSPNNWYKKNFIGKVVLDGTEAWTNMGWSTSLGYAFRTPINDMKQTSSASDLPNCISNYYQNYTYNNLQSTTIDYGIANRTNYAQIVFRNDDYTSATDFKDWLTTHNTTVYYILATPTEEQITDTTLITQLNNLYNATSQDGTTYITCSSASDSNEAIIINATALMKGGI